MKVKICGITNLEDAQVAVEAGADYLGFILYPPSKRAVDIKDVQSIVSHLRGSENCPVLVGVFVSETAEFMADVMDKVGLDLAQLSGEEVPALIGDENSPIYGRSFKALQPTSLEEAEADAEWFISPKPHPQAPSLLHRFLSSNFAWWYGPDRGLGDERSACRKAPRHYACGWLKCRKRGGSGATSTAVCRRCCQRCRGITRQKRS